MRVLWILLAALIVAGAGAGVRALRAGPEPAAWPPPAGADPVVAVRASEAPPSDAPASPQRATDTPRSQDSGAAKDPPPAAPAATPAATSAPAAAPGDDAQPADASATSVEPLEGGGGILLDGRFVVRGRGTESDPFQVPWDLLVSAQERYDPAQDRHTLPSRVTMLSGQVVSITGYFAAPVGAEEASELLIMLNKWDGCCLGLPPTPYDAVEVKLDRPVTLRGRHMIRYGTVTGRFECEPFLIGGWLVGLYRMKDATLHWGG